MAQRTWRSSGSVQGTRTSFWCTSGGRGRADDSELRNWLARYRRLSVSPATWVATDRLIVETYVRSVLSAIRVPALVLHRRDNAWMRVGHARYLVEHIPDARAIRCAMAIRDASQSLDLRVRTGLHAGEVLVSSRVADPVAGSDLTFDSRGRQTLKGIPRKWELLLARHDPTAADS